MTDWKLSGTVLLACNCDYGCPCNFNGRPTEGKCEGGWSWHVEEGAYGDVGLDGLNLSLWADWPGAIHEGDGRAVLFVDERADERQRSALGELAGGAAGGPWGIFRNTFSSVEGPHYVPYELSLDGDRSALRIGDAVELEMEPVRNPVTGAEVHPRAVLPEGLVFKEGALLASKAFRVLDGVSYDHSGKYAALAPFEYRGP